VIIDHCSGCKGIWLDQGELAKIIAHMKQVESSLEAEFRPSYERRESYDRPHEDRRYDKHYDKYQHKNKSGFEKLFARVSGPCGIGPPYPVHSSGSYHLWVAGLEKGGWFS
jgi:uncharacterized protein